MSTLTQTPRRQPRLGVVYDLGSATPVTIRTAAHRLCDLVFVADRARPHAAASWDALERLAPVVDVTGLTAAQRIAAVADVAPDGIVTFSEYQLAETARIASALNLPFHDEPTASVLTDKWQQRRRLAAAGIDDTPCALVDPDDPGAALAVVGVPAVVKPRHGAGSMHTVRIASASQWHDALAPLPLATEPFVAERLLVGDAKVAGEAWGDYVSVESVSTPGRAHQVCITGKFPLAEPFRETGMFLPCSLDDITAAQVLDLEAAARRALGVRFGVTHTEIKLTADGPRVIEVNGRVGGYVPEILKRATGVDLIRLAMLVALGAAPDVPAPRHRDVTYQYFLAPPMRSGALAAVDGADNLAALPGVRHVDLHARPGDVIDWRDGTQAHLGIVYGSARDLDALRDTARALATSLEVTYV